MKNNTGKAIIYFTSIIFLISCKSSLNYFESYARDGKKSTYLKKKYKRIDAINKVKIKLCKEREIPILGHTDGAITFNSKSLKEAIVNSMKNHFKNIEHKESNTGAWSWGCEQVNAKNYRNSKTELAESNTNTEKNYVDVTFQLKYMTSKNIEYGAFFESSADLGNDAHQVKYKIIVALFKNGVLEYMYNQAHWTVILSERSEKLHYEVPQEVIDTLVNNSLKEYYNRLN